MNTIAKSINQIITALDELEAKGCHSVFLEYGNGLLRVRIFRGTVELDAIVYERTINLTEGQEELDETLRFINNLIRFIHTTVFQCYRREFVLGEKAGNWEKTEPFFEFGENATQSMLIDCSGYYLDDPDNHLQYFVSYKELSEADK